MSSEVAFYVKAIEDRKRELQSSSWLEQVFTNLDAVHPAVEEIRCLALGSVADFVNPRFQLAFLLLLASKLGASNITAWDPAFQDMDRLVLEHYGIKVQATDPSPADTVLWYVPHGPFSLVANLPSVLGRSVYIGNDLSSFPLEGKDERRLVDEYKSRATITSIVPAKHDRWLLAFSSTAIHKAA